MNKLLITIWFLVPAYGWAQADWENPKGTIKTEEVVIEKEKQLELPQVSRRFTSIPVAPIPIDSTAIAYEPSQVAFNLPKVPVVVRPRTMKSELLDPVYWGVFKLGYGSFLSPYVQADVATKRNDEYNLAAHFRHFSSKKGPVDETNSGMGTTNGYVSGSYFFNKATLAARAGVAFNRYNLYGYGVIPPNSGFIVPEQKFSQVNMLVSLTDNDAKNTWYYQLETGIDLFKVATRNWTENDFYAKANVDAPLGEELGFKLSANAHFATQSYALANQSRLLVALTPIATYTMGSFNFEAGAGLFTTRDSINSYAPKFYAAPHLVARYATGNGYMFLAGVTGNVQWQSARMQFMQNPYLATTVINSRVNPIDLFVEATGKLAPKVDAGLGFHTRMYKVYGQFINAANPSEFDINYLTEANYIHQLDASIEVAGAKNLLFTWYGNYSIFGFANQQQPYHVPQFETGLAIRYTIEHKLETEFEMSYLSGILALDQATATEIALNPILDINLNTSYRINAMFGAFVKLQNILGNEYQYYNRYPVKGFQAMAGVSITL